MDKKGFAISSMLYMILILFLALITGIMANLANQKIRLDKVKEDILGSLNNKEGGTNDIDNLPPVIAFTGTNNLLDTDTTFDAMQGITVTDDQTLSAQIIVSVSGTVSVGVPGTYQLLYTAIDMYGNTSTFSRTVVVYRSQYTFDYSGNEQTFSVPIKGTYKLEVWGAEGGRTLIGGTIVNGYGGYSVGEASLNKGSNLYIHVGGAGKITTSSSTVVAGGYNGGGQGYSYSDGRGGASGGGATHIATSSGVLTGLSTNQNAILIVAGGGGGAAQCCNGYNKVAGSGGGYIGGTGSYNGTSAPGGTQSGSAGGNYAGAFGRGGNCTSNDCAGGGGGFYGGPASTGGGGYGAGGSGYIANASLKNKFMYCYNCTTSPDVTTKTYTTTSVSATPTVNYAKSGNGYAKLTLISFE